MFGGRAVLFLICLSGIAGFFIGQSSSDKVSLVVPQLEAVMKVPKAYAGTKLAQEVMAVKPKKIETVLEPALPEEDKLVPAKKPLEETDSFVLDGLMQNDNGVSYALIREAGAVDASIVTEGETVNGYTLSHVGTSTVTLLKGDELLMINIEE